MTNTSDRLEQVIRDSGEGWLIDWYEPKDGAMLFLRQRIARVNALARGRTITEINEQTIIDLFAQRPDKVQAFLQALGSTQSEDMLVMVWRILEGMAIDEVRMQYIAEESFNLYVRLVTPEARVEEYQSRDINDAAVLRHLGIIKMGEKPIFDGYYALNLR
jgi:hypothetical protein